MQKPSEATPLGVKLLAWVLVVIIAPMLLIALIEGGSSLILLALALRRDVLAQDRMGRVHAQYDPELGWSSVPERVVPDMFGPRVRVQIDSQGFRVTGASALRAGERIRVVCSGDSFTFGMGVADDRTWCARLAAIEPRLAPINMGQSGYGVDQTYLWYKRDGSSLGHELHVFAYITNDFRRMMSASLYGHAKPVLVLRHDSLAVGNTPVPRSDAGARAYWTALVLRNQLRLAQLLLLVRDSVFHGHGIQQGSLTGEWTEEDSLTWVKVRRITADLSRVNRGKGSTLVLVHLPVIEDYWTPQADPWRERAAAAAEADEFIFVDLVRELRRLPGDSMEQMFIGHAIPGYGDGVGHYSVAGNEWVAQMLARRLRQIPAVAARLDRAFSTRQDPDP